MVNSPIRFMALSSSTFTGLPWRALRADVAAIRRAGRQGGLAGGKVPGRDPAAQLNAVLRNRPRALRAGLPAFR